MVDFRINNLSFTYPCEKSKALDNISLEINRGEFIVLAGKSGSGKSTLLRMLKPELSPHGEVSGDIFFFGKHKNEFTPRESAESIGYLLQNTEYQTVTHSVRSELAFGLENSGFDSGTIRLRIAEISAYFALDKILDKKTSELSGGQKQLVCLAGILAMHPKAVIFDEPSSQLDPMAAQTLFSTAEKLCRENGMTVIITEHRLENLIPSADRLIILEKGRIISDSHPSQTAGELFSKNEYVSLSMPAPVRIAAALGFSQPLPLNTGDCRRLFEEYAKGRSFLQIPPGTKDFSDSEKAVEAKHIYFAYNKSGYILRDLSLTVPKGSFFALLGANAAGKSTAISVISGLLPCKTGKIKIFGKDIKKYKEHELYNGITGVLPQKCESLFSGNTVYEDLEKTLSGLHLSKEERREKINSVAHRTRISELLMRHPYDISGGEMQRAALAMVLLKEPKIIFMDEPTKGMDPIFKKQFAQIIRGLCDKGVSVIMVSHDTEFCGEYCDLCALMSDGMCVTSTDRYEFFSNNYFYTTGANKIARDFCPYALTEKEVTELCTKSHQKQQ